MLSIEECEKILNNIEGGQNYSKKEIKEIRDLLYALANIEYSEYKININGKERSVIYQSFN